MPFLQGPQTCRRGYEGIHQVINLEPQKDAALSGMEAAILRGWQKALQRVVKSAQYITVSTLPSIQDVSTAIPEEITGKTPHIQATVVCSHLCYKEDRKVYKSQDQRQFLTIYQRTHEQLCPIHSLGLSINLLKCCWYM